MHPVVFWVVAYFVTGICVGLLTAAIDIFQKWSKGEDIVLKDLGDVCLFLLVGFFIWPLIICFLVAEFSRNILGLNKHTVILKGSKSAKVHKALMND